MSEKQGEGDNRFRKAVFGGVTDGRHDLLSEAERANTSDRSLDKSVFGYPVAEALDLGYRISRKGIIEATHSPIAKETVRVIRHLHPSTGTNAPLHALDLFGGSAQYSWELAKAGFQVDSVEADSCTADNTRSNVALAGLETINVINTSASSFVDNAQSEGSHYSAVILDPPWGKRYERGATDVFSLQHTEPPLDELVARVNSLADIIVFKVPANVDRRELVDLGYSVKRNMLLETQKRRGSTTEKTSGLITVYLHGSGNKHIEEAFVSSV